MITTSHLLDPESLSRLSRLRGSSWRYFGSAQMSEWMTDTSIFVATSNGDLTISGEASNLDFEGESDSYSRFRIEGGATDQDAASRTGYVHHFDAGECINDVLVVRESVTALRDGFQSWSYVNDLAIVFNLDNGIIAIAKVSHHSELLSVIRATNLDSLTFEESSHAWQDKLDLEFHFERDMLSVSDLVSK